MKELLRKAREGNLAAQETLRDKYSLKVWTHEAIKGLNYLRSMKPNLPRLPPNKFFPDFEWMQDCGEGYYLVGSGSKTWFFKLNDKRKLLFQITDPLPGGSRCIGRR
jgi:hypothetical protein